MQMVILTTDGEFLETLTKSEFDKADVLITIGNRQRVPGAFESHWQLAVDFGLMSAPISILCNMIASWLFEALKRAPKPTPPQVKIVIRDGKNAIEIELSLDSKENAQLQLEVALTHDDIQR